MKKTGSIVLLACIAAMSVARVAAASARILDGRILVVGGQGADYIAVASVEIYNPSR